MSSAGLIAGPLGWEAVFYAHGGIAAIWCVLWAVFVTDSPDDHPWISIEERNYILSSKKAGGRKVSFRWID